LIIGHDNIDAARLMATLRILFGDDHEIRCTPTLGDAVNRVNARAPDIVFLTEALKPSSDTSQAVTLLRGAGLSGPIIIIGGHMTRARRARVIICDADDVIDKDDIDSVRIGEALALIRSPSKSG